MSLKTFFRLFILFLLISAGLVLISYRNTKAIADNKECSEGEKCSQQKSQTEFMLWESLSRSLFDSNN